MSNDDTRMHPLPVEFEGWFTEHPDEDRAGLAEVWGLARRADTPFELNTKRTQALRTAVLGGPGPQKPTLRLFRINRIWLTAAAILVAFGLWWVATPVTYETQPGELLVVDLSDGSTVRLNAGSTLRKGRLFGVGSRSVELDGEAFFDVASSEALFTVATFNTRIKVLGTRFNVRARSTESTPATSVWVEEGLVQVESSRDPHRSVQLKARSMGVVDGNLIQSDRVGAGPGPTSWLEGGFSFSDVPLQDAVQEIERRFGVAVGMTPDSLRTLPISLHVSRASEIGTVLELLAAAHDLEIRPVTDGYILRAR